MVEAKSEENPPLTDRSFHNFPRKKRYQEDIQIKISTFARNNKSCILSRLPSSFFFLGSSTWSCFSGIFQRNVGVGKKTNQTIEMMSETVLNSSSCLHGNHAFPILFRMISGSAPPAGTAAKSFIFLKLFTREMLKVPKVKILNNGCSGSAKLQKYF